MTIFLQFLTNSRKILKCLRFLTIQKIFFDNSLYLLTKLSGYICQCHIQRKQSLKRFSIGLFTRFSRDPMEISSAWQYRASLIIFELKSYFSARECSAKFFVILRAIKKSSLNEKYLQCSNSCRHEHQNNSA